VLAVVADSARRAHFAKLGAVLAEGEDLERNPGLACEFEHVAIVDPPCFSHLDRLATRPCREGGYLHRVWSEAEWRVANATLAARHAQRRELIAVFKDLRAAGKIDGERFRQVLRGEGRFPRSPQTAARCLRVLAELGLVVVSGNLSDGVTGVVSSQRTDLERSAAYRAYSARYQEGHQYLENRRQS
jgi:single-stranded-DNA-specific exonuclease